MLAPSWGSRRDTCLLLICLSACLYSALLPILPFLLLSPATPLDPAQTLAYLLPALALSVQRAEEEMVAAQQQHGDRWPMHVGQVQALVVVPSRELAMQVRNLGVRRNAHKQVH